jgi:hypothetical protein
MRLTGKQQSTTSFWVAGCILLSIGLIVAGFAVWHQLQPAERPNVASSEHAADTAAVASAYSAAPAPKRADLATSALPARAPEMQAPNASAVAAGTPDAAPAEVVRLPADMHGEEAITALGDKLADVAAAHQMSAEALRNELRKDSDLWVGEAGHLFYACTMLKEPAPAKDEPAKVGNSAVRAATAPTTVEADTVDTNGNITSTTPLMNTNWTFRLSSRPGASKTIYLDFTGHTTSNTVWNNSTMGASFYSPPFNIEGTSASFSSAEHARIQQVWQQVAEDYAPFDVNVTTLEPPTNWLMRSISDSTDTNWGIRVVITGYGPNSSSLGGCAERNSFRSSKDTPCFVYNTRFESMAEGCSHEVGHTLGLSHDGTSTDGYYNGHGSGETSWAPIMGVGYDCNVTTWDNGVYFDSNNGGPKANSWNSPEDMTEIAGYNGFGFRQDTIGNSLTSATPLTVSSGAVGQYGTILTRLDKDVFSFQLTNAGSVNFTVDPYWYRAFVTTSGVWGGSTFTYTAPVTPARANLDVSADLYNAAGVLLASANPAGLAATLSCSGLPAGTYFLQVDGVGFGNPTINPPTGYTDYGSVGNYWISGTISNAVTPGNQLPTYVVSYNNSESFVGVPEGGTNTFQIRLSSQPTSDVVVAVAWSAGDANLTVTGGASLTFTTNNWSTNQTVTVAAAEDADAVNGTASITCSSPGMNAVAVTATETENDTTLTIAAGTGGTVLPSGATVVTMGAATAIAATASANFAFTNWSVTSGAATFANSNAPSTTVTISAPATIRANFVRTNINHSPVITEGANVPVTMSEDGAPTAFALTLHATDADGDTLTWSVATPAAHGTATASGTGASQAIAYTPTANYNGTDSFAIQVSDGVGGAVTTTVSVTIQSVNDAPVAVAQSVSTLMNTAKAITLSGSDPEGSNLTYVATQPAYGTLIGTGTSRTYTPNTGYLGADSFTFRVNDSALDSAPATVSILVGGIFANGGTVTNYTVGGTNWTAHIFTTVGTSNLIVTAGGNVEVLVVGGGGGGGKNGGGGGAGGLVYSNGFPLVAGTYTVSVGGGGAASTGGSGGNGTNSVFSNSVSSAMVAMGGGGGGALGNIGLNGGSGGGGGGVTTVPTKSGGTNTVGQGYMGGSGGVLSGNWGGNGGGGGAGSAGLPGDNSSNGGNGGRGVYVSAFTGVVASTVGTTNDGWFAGGGGGAEVNGTVAGAGGRGGGGRSNINLPGTAGSPNTGGGGGGGCWKGSDNQGGAGGSGIVVVRYVANGGQSTNLPTTYAVTYNANGATGAVPSSQIKTQDVTLVLASNSGALAKTGYTFAGWNTAADGSGTNYATGASYTANAAVTLYAAWTAVGNGVSATGGTVTNYTQNGINYRAHIFTNVGSTNINVSAGGNVEYLVVGGGGGGGSARYSGAAGGGGGGVLTSNLTFAAGTYTITVGAGGGGGTNSGGYGMNGFNGGDSSITNAGGSVSVIAKGGGGGGGDYRNNGSNGASGGGGAKGDSLGGSPGSNNVPGQGRNGGAGHYSSHDGNSSGGGGGGYGGVGQNATINQGGNGGVGLTNSFTGVAVGYAGGGGGGKRSSTAIGYGNDGGGNGVKGAPTAGRVNSGGGGGGNGTDGPTPVNGAAGGSGIVIVRYVVGSGGATNQAPTAIAQSVSTAEDTAKAIVLTGGDPEGSNLTFTVVSNPTHGTLSGTAPNVTYTPDANYNGADSFTFRASDGKTNSNVATVSITVTPVNDAPVANAQSVTTAEDTAKAITLTGSDPEGSNLTYAVVSNPAHGTLSGTAPNVTYTPDANYNGADSFTFQASDGKTNSNVATVSITVTAVNDAPVAMAGVDPVVGSITDEFYFWAMDSYDVDGTITGREWQINGTVVSTNAEFLYTFATGGAYTVTLAVWDNEGASGSDSVEVNVSEPITPVVSVSVLDGVAGEPGLALGSGRFQVSRIGELTQPLTVNYAMSGTASNGVDYSRLSGTVTLAAGVVSRTVVVDPLADALVEGTEWAILSLADGTGYTVDEDLSAGAVMIQDQTYGTPVVTAVAMDASATEPGLTTDKGSIKISRTGSCNAALTVLVAVSGTAVNGVDYSTLTVPVVLAVGQNAKTLAIVPLADGAVESSETVTLTIQANAAYVIGSGQAAATVTIRDNTQVATPTVSVVATDPNAAEPGAFVNTGTFTFSRTSRFHETLVMNCTIGGTASNGTDYNTVSGVVTFPAGVATKTLTIIPKADGVTEGSEAVVMTIQASAAYAIEVGKSAATVTITE